MRVSRGRGRQFRRRRFSTASLLTPLSAVVGELDEDLDANLDLSLIRAPPLKAIGN